MTLPAAASRRTELAKDLQALTDNARRAFGADAVAVVGTTPDGGLEVLSSAGLLRRAIADLESGGEADLAAHLAREYESVVSADVAFDGERHGSIHALQRTAGQLEHTETIEAYAVQAAIAIAMRRRAAPDALAGPGEPAGLLDRLVLSVHSLEELSLALGDALGPLFGGARVGVMVADRERMMLQTLPGAFGAPHEVTASHRMSFFDPRSNSARVLMTGRSYISNTSEGDAGIRQEYVDVFHIYRVLTVPLEGVGVMHLVNGDQPFGLDDVARAEAFAPRIANVMEIALRLFGHERQQRLEETLASVAVAVASGRRIESFLPAALRKLCAATDAALVAFVSGDAAPVLSRRGEPDAALERTVLAEAGSEPGMRAYVVSPQKPGDPGWAAFYVPVHLGPSRVGTLAALRVRGEPFSRAERDSFARMANLAALAHATERYQRQRSEVVRLQERQRIADDLHDDVAQILFAAQLCLDGVLAEDGLEADVAKRVARARGLLIRGDTAIRTVIERLSTPPPAADVAARLTSVVAGVEEEFELVAHLEVAPDAAVMARRLRRAASDALLRVAREALVNCAKHAGRCRVTVRLEAGRRDRVLLTVTDDGRGFGVRDGNRHGLASLRALVREQGGVLRIASRPGGGTRVAVSLPVVAEPAAPAPPADRLAEATVLSARARA